MISIIKQGNGEIEEAVGACLPMRSQCFPNGILLFLMLNFSVVQGRGPFIKFYSGVIADKLVLSKHVQCSVLEPLASPHQRLMIGFPLSLPGLLRQINPTSVTSMTDITRQNDGLNLTCISLAQAFSVPQLVALLWEAVTPLGDRPHWQKSVSHSGNVMSGSLFPDTMA